MTYRHLEFLGWAEPSCFLPHSHYYERTSLLTCVEIFDLWKIKITPVQPLYIIYGELKRFVPVFWHQLSQQESTYISSTHLWLLLAQRPQLPS